MKTTLSLLLAYIFLMVTSTEIVAQVNSDTTKIREIGIGLRGINDFSVQYFWGSNKRLYRISGDIGGGYSRRHSSYFTTTLITPSISSEEATYLNFGVNFSMFKKRFVSDKFGYLFGEVISLDYIRRLSKSNTTAAMSISGTTETTIRTELENNFRPALGLLLGAFYTFTSKVYLYVEIRPQIYYSFGKSLTTTESIKTVSNPIETSTWKQEIPSSHNSIGVTNISNTGALVTLVYRISD